MDLGEHAALWLVKERLAELRAAAQRAHLAGHPPRGTARLRVAMGVGLVRVGTWLLREEIALAHDAARR